MVWVKWEIICKSKGEGGLGIKDLKSFNMMFLEKWKWRLGKEEKGLWRNILLSKYGSWRSLNNLNERSNKSRWWSDLRNVYGYGDKGEWLNN